MMTGLSLALLALFVVFVLGCLFLTIFAPTLIDALFAPRAKTQGEFVAEVWLEWSLCRGSTMYRQRFLTAERAARAARFYARVLDWILPQTYADANRHGRRTRCRYELGIRWGVRRLTLRERETFRAFLTTVMPGHAGHRGEHVDAHPCRTMMDGVVRQQDT